MKPEGSFLPLGTFYETFVSLCDGVVVVFLALLIGVVVELRGYKGLVVSLSI